MRTLLAALLALTAWLAVRGEAPPTPFDRARPAFRSWGIEEGLPSDTPYALMLDSRGRLWAGTQEGLAVLGGKGWARVPFPQEATSSFVRAMLEDRSGAYWFGTQDDGLWRLDRGRWTHFRGGKELPSHRINALIQLGDGQILAGTWGAGVHRFDQGRWVPLDLPEGAGELNVWKLRETRDPVQGGRLWVCAQTGLWTRGSRGWSRMGAETGLLPGGVNDLVEMARPDGSRTLWAACWGRGVAAFEGDRWRYQGPAEGFPSPNPTSLAVTRDLQGNPTLWAGTFDGGIATLQEGRWRSILGLAGTAAAPQQITGVYSLLANPGRKPILWLGGRGTGLVALDPSGWRTLDPTGGLPSAFATAFLQTGDPESYWIGTDKGVARWEAGKVTVEDQAQGLPSSYINGLALFGGRGEIWAATLRGVAVRRGGRWIPAADLPPIQATSLETGTDEGGGPALFASFDGGLGLLAGGRWRFLTPREGLPHPYVSALHFAPGDRSLWAAFRGGGVARWKGGRWTTWGEGSGLPNLSVSCLAESRSPDGRRWIWAGTLGGGLARRDMDAAGSPWEIFNAQNLPSLRSQTLFRLEWDRAGRLYLMTAGGVVRLELVGPDGRPGNAQTFTQGDGLPSLALNFGASYLDSRGRIWVGTSRGIGILDPEVEHPPSRTPMPVLERIQAGSQPLDPKAGLEIGHGHRSLTFGFNLGSFHRREDIRYRSQLEGLEAEPTEWRSEAEREFTGLGPGAYLFRLWAQDYQGRITGPLELPFRVATPPWKQPWAYALYALALLLLVRWSLHVRTRFLEERNRALEALVADRTQALEFANLALHAQTMTDPLTGVSNRRALMEILPDDMMRLFRRYSAENLGGPVVPTANRDMAFLMVDLDLFKAVNDTYGHQAGDRVLQQFADVLRACVRETDRIVRWGGEEFLVVARDTRAEEVPTLAERIRASVEAQGFSTGLGGAIHRTCSIGFACFPLLLRDPGFFAWEQVVGLADQCLYEAKRRGRNRWIGLLPHDEARPELELDAKTLTVEQLVQGDLVTRVESGAPAVP